MRRHVSHDLYTPADPLNEDQASLFTVQGRQAKPLRLVPNHGEEHDEGLGRLHGRRVLITGADTGIGRSIALAFAQEGADVAISYMREHDNAQEIRRSIEAAGRKVVLLPGNVSHERDCVSIVDDAAVALGGLDVLVTFASAQSTGDLLDDFDTVALDLTMRANVYSLFWLTRAASAHFEPGAAIITTSSIQAFHRSPQSIAYATSKAAIVDFTRAAAQRLANQGIRVNGIAPVPIWTRFQSSTAHPKSPPHLAEKASCGRPSELLDLASTYVDLASQESSYASGETIIVDGGEPRH